MFPKTLSERFRRLAFGMAHGNGGSVAAEEPTPIPSAAHEQPANTVPSEKRAADLIAHAVANVVKQAVHTDDPASDMSDVERLIESDPALVPKGPSQLLVAPRVLDDAEVQALLEGLSPLLEGLSHCEADHESHAATAGCSRSHPQLSPLAWLFPHHAGAGRPARHKQGDHLRARRSAGKKARPASRQAQGSLFGDHR
jgi:hypothetical protein